MADIQLLTFLNGLQLRMSEKLDPSFLKLSEWKAATKHEVVEWLRGKEKPKKTGSQLIVRTRLRPIDVYCYLKARFGEPNGFQNALSRDDSDNWIHWDYSLKAADTDIYIAGASREIHFMISEQLNDQQWRDLIIAIKTDFAQTGKQKSEVLKGLEKFVVFQNKFVSLASLCADLHAAILDAPTVNKNLNYPDVRAYEAAMKQNAADTLDLAGNCLKLHLLTPIMAEAFINMVILMFTRDAIRNNENHYQDFIRSRVPDRLALLSENCDGFARKIDKTTIAYSAFMRVIDKRNFSLHGNVNPIKEQLEIVYFDGRRPLFNQPGNILENHFEQIEAIHKPDQIVADYEAVHEFLIEVTECLKPSTREFFEQVINDAYPGFDVNKKRVTRILPDKILMGVIEGHRYDDQLDVEW